MLQRLSLAFIILLIISSTAISMPQITSSISTEFGTYVPNIVNTTPNVPNYIIKPDLGNVANQNLFQFTNKEKELLAKNGFVVDQTKYKQVYDIYNDCQKKNIPIFVTTDSMLHVYHILYDYTLRILETRKLYDDLYKLNGTMLKSTMSQYDSATDPLAKSAVKRNLAYFTVASVLLDPSITIPAEVKDIVNAELELIDAHKGFDPSPIFGYDEDYSQYVPRGHYTRNETLSRYFKSMMWYGRMMFRISPREGKEKAIDETLQAIILISAIKNANIGAESALSLWDRIYEPTVFFVGKSDDLNVYEYMEIMEKIYGSNYASMSPDKLADVTKIEAFIEEAKDYRSPMINSTLVWEGKDSAVVTKGFRFMGQRFIPDSYMFQQLVHDKVTGRMFPKGLDILAIMGSDRAYDILTNVYKENSYPKYTEQIAKLKDAFAMMDDGVWAQNLYWNWLYVLMPLLDQKGVGYPMFMQNVAWTDKDLSTALGSWTELRHDTILYAKQSYTTKTSLPPTPQLIKGYVEPNPELYARLASLATFTREGLSDRGLLLQEFSSKFKQLEDLLLSLKEISELELMNQPLSNDQYGQIVNIGKALESIVTFPPDISSEIENQEDESMAIVADVHTDPNGEQVLEEGVGYPMNIFVVVPVNGELRITQGAIFSYYEFVWKMSNRLTDGEWQKKIESDPPALPIWTGSFIDLSVKPELGQHFTVESEMTWRPMQLDVNIKPEIIEAGTVIEVNAFIQGNLESPPIVTLKQGDVTLKSVMKGEFGTYTASVDTKGMKSGIAHVTISGKLGEEDVRYDADLMLEKSSAVESSETSNSHSGKAIEIKTRIYAVYPNPFNPDVWIPYDIENSDSVNIEIYNALGQLIRTIDLGYKARGHYVDANKAAHWDGRNSHGEQVTSGVYFYKLKAGNFVAIGKMIAVK
jgi:hypothetical protein